LRKVGQAAWTARTDYYFVKDEKSKISQTIFRHVQKMFELLGGRSRKAAEEANLSWQFETSLASGALKFKASHPRKYLHKMTRAELAALGRISRGRNTSPIPKSPLLTA